MAFLQEIICCSSTCTQCTYIITCTCTYTLYMYSTCTCTYSLYSTCTVQYGTHCTPEYTCAVPHTLTQPHTCTSPPFCLPPHTTHTRTASYITSLFNPHTLPTDECVETHRVTQLTHILRNLSFSETSAKHLASNTAVHRYSTYMYMYTFVVLMFDLFSLCFLYMYSIHNYTFRS